MAAPWERDWSGTKVMGSAAAERSPSGFQSRPGGGFSPTQGGPAYLDKTLSLSKDFTGRKEVEAYRTAVPILRSIMNAPPGGGGDLDVVNGVSKILDPTSAVMQGEADSARNSDGVISGMLATARNELSQTGKLSPDMRRRLIAAGVNRASALSGAYNMARDDTVALGNHLGLPSQLTVGSHPGDQLVRAGLANYSGSGLNRGKLGLPFIVKSDRDYARVPVGQRYQAPDGTIRTKKGR